MLGMFEGRVTVRQREENFIAFMLCDNFTDIVYVRDKLLLSGSSTSIYYWSFKS